MILCSTKYRNIHAAYYCVLLFKVLNQHCMLQLVSSNVPRFEIQNNFFLLTAVYQFQFALGIKISTISKRRKVPTLNHPESCSDFRCLSPILTKFIKRYQVNVNRIAFPSVIIPELLQL